MELWIFSLAAFFTSTFAAALGQGGGLMLMPVLAGAVPSALLIPVHGFIQIASNGSRALLSLKHVDWALIRPIFSGIVVGSLLLLPFIADLNWQWMQSIMGLFILYLTWGPGIKLPSQSITTSSFFTLGALQGSLGMIIGATGPLGSALMLRKGLSKDQIVATNAIIMMSTHLLKVILFTSVGVAIWEYWPLLLAMSVAAILGSVAGSKIRHRMNEPLFFKLFKSLLTLLAIRMLVLPWL